MLVGWQEAAHGMGQVVHRACSGLVCQGLLAVAGKVCVGVGGGADERQRPALTGAAGDAPPRAPPAPAPLHVPVRGHGQQLIH